MNRLRFFSLLLCFVLACRLPVFAEETDSPFTMAKSYSADMEITTSGTTITNKVFADDGKMRTEVDAQGMQMVSIIRPDQQKIYSVMPAQKMIMVLPYDATKTPEALAATGPQGKFDLIGPDQVRGISCTKYKVTSQDGKTYFMWVDLEKKIPVKVAAEDGSFSILWKNFREGPQKADLFQPPTDYKTMTMPQGIGL